MSEANDGSGTAIVRRQTPGFLDADTKEGWELVARKAKALSQSSIIPKDYRGSPNNVLVAMEMAQRTDLPVLAVMQNLHIIQGKPSWSAQFLIAAVNRSGRFSPLRFEFEGEEGTDEWGCRAVATDLEDGEVLRGTLIDIAMAKAEGWYQKAGSKWKTMPEQMLRYRAAAFWARSYSPELAVGLHTTDEVVDMGPSEDDKVDDLNARIAAKRDGEGPHDRGEDTEDEDSAPTGEPDLGARVDQLASLIQRAKNAKGVTKPDYEEYELALADAEDGKLDASEVGEAIKGLSTLLVESDVLDQQAELV